MYKHVSEKAAAVNTEGVECWRNNVLPKIAKVYIGSEIFIVVKCGLFFIYLPMLINSNAS